MVLSILLQGASAASDSVGSGNGGSFFPGDNRLIWMMVLVFVIMWLFMFRPQQKRQKEIEKQRAALKSGDKVLTSGGIHGTLKEVNDLDYVVEIANGVKIKIDKTSVFAAPNETSSSK